MLRISRSFGVFVLAFAIAAAIVALQRSLRADTTAQPVPFSQNWTNTALITTANDWSGVPGIIAYRGDAMVAATGVDPQTILTDGSSTPVNVLANQSNPNTLTTGGIAEFDVLPNPTIALQGSGTARAPHIVISLNTTGIGGINISYNLRDIDGSADNAVQPVALQYRVGSTGNFINLPAGFVADASQGPSLATLVTSVSVNLPAAVDNQPLVQVRIITSDAVGSDEWIGVDDITISNALSASGIATPNLVQQGGSTLLTVSVTPATNPSSTGIEVTADLTPINGLPKHTLFDDGVAPDLVAGDNVFSYLAGVPNNVPAGAKLLPVSVSDGQFRTTTTSIALTVTDAPAPTVVTLPFFQDWSNIGLISSDDNWSHVPGIVGYRGDGLTGATGVDPQTIVGENGVVDVNANRLNPDTFTTGGVAEFEIGDPTVALQGSGTARAPNLVLQVETTGNTGILVSYDLRDLDGSVDNSIQPVALQYRLGSAAPFVNLPGAFVADATTGPSLANQLTHVSVLLPPDANNQPLVQIRFITSDAVGSDEWVGIDNISVTSGIPSGVGAATPAIVVPGGATLLTVAVTPGTGPISTGLGVSANLSAIGGSVTQTFFDDGTNGDAAANDNVFSFQATVSGATPEGFVSMPGQVSDAQFRSSTFTIPLTVEAPAQFFAIDQIQGEGAQSPLKGLKVATQGVVTGVKTSGFFIQTPDGQDDGNATTSEGIFVFTGSAPPQAAAVGNLVSVTGFVQEFVPAADPSQPPVTEIGGPFVSLLSTGHPLPAAVDLTAADTPTTGGLDVLERFEGMRVHVASLTVTGPTQGFVSEPNASATSNGVFYGVITGVDRPFREAGIQLPDPLPAGAPANVPRFDGNPERLRVDSDGLVGGQIINVASGDEVLDLVGPLDYTFRTYQLLPDPATLPTVVAHRVSATAVPEPQANQFTIGAANLERFFDTVNDPGIGEPVLSQTAFNTRLNKASLYIRNVMRTPDILGVEEVENLQALQALANKINADASAAGQPDPNYLAFLEEGNDVGGIDSGFLVKTARVEVVGVEQVGKATTYTNPLNNEQEILNDRPPLVLTAVVHGSAGAAFPVTVIVNHLRSLSGVDDPADGARVRAKRRAQAEFLANYIQARQAFDANEHIVSVGDYNAFQLNDGFVDSIGTIKGTPSPSDQVTLASLDLVNPDLIDLVDLLPQEERYSFIFDGNGQVLDHELITQNLLGLFAGVAVARNNADFPESARNDANTPERISDHDPIVGYFNLPAPTQTALASSVNPSAFGQNITLTATVQSAGLPVTEGSVTFTDGGVPLGPPVLLNGNGQATINTSLLPVGDRTIEAQYGGAANFMPSSGSIVQSIKPGMSINDVTVTESNSASFVVSLSAPSTETIIVQFATADGTAVGGSDYGTHAGTIAFAPGMTTQVVTVDVINDVLNEPDEIFQVTLSNPINALIVDPQGIGTIINDDPLPSLSITDVTVTEPDTGTMPAVFTVNLSAASGQTVAVSFATANGSALAGQDYVNSQGTLVFAPGEISQTVTVTINGDNFNEPVETFFVALSNPVNATLQDAQATGTIVNTDPLPSLSIDDVTLRESFGGIITTFNFVVHLSASSGQTVFVDYATADGTATAGADYIPTTGRVSFAPGADSGFLTVTVLGERPREKVQSFFVNLSNPVNASLADGQAVGTIFDAAAPLVDSFTPAAGTRGTAVTITGRNFTAITSVKFNGVPATFQMRGIKRIIAIVPQGATTGPISVSNASGTGTSATQFVVSP